MIGAQDMGGQMGFGPVAPEADEPVFHADWERRAFALNIAAGAMGVWTVDTGRYLRETLPPATYLASSYYELWIRGLERLLTSSGLASAEELARGRADQPGKPVPRVLQAAQVARALATGSRSDRPLAAPARFKVGDKVRTKVLHHGRHTRLPRYAFGRLGTIETVHGGFVFADTVAHGEGEHPQWLYTVGFTARELWGEAGDPMSSVTVEAWESYLDPAG
jgi:nitrile hydratase